MLLNTGNLEIAVFLVMQLDLISQELTGHLPAGPRRPEEGMGQTWVRGGQAKSQWSDR